jgi:hypothetical protein
VKILSFVLVLFLVGCGSGGNSSTGGGGGGNAIPAIQGKWTVKATSTQSSGNSLVLVDFTDQGNGSFYAPQVVMCNYSANVVCTGALIDNKTVSVTGTANAQGALNISLSTQQSGVPCTITATGQLSGSSMSGQYTGCQDAGTWAGFSSTSVTGHYAGTINSTANPGLIAVGFSANITEASNYALTGSASLTNSVCFNSLTFGSPSTAVGEGVLLVDSTHGVVVVAAPSEPGPNLAYYVNSTQYCGSDQGTGTLTKQ